MTTPAHPGSRGPFVARIHTRFLLTALALLAPAFARAEVTPEFAAKLTPAELAWVRANPVVTVGIDDRWRPMTYRREDGTLVGLDIDLLNRMSELTGLTFRTVSKATWAETLEATRRGEIHTITGLGETEERRKTMLFGKPYIVSPVVYITRTDAPFLTGPESSGDRRITLPSGYFFSDLIEKDHPGLNFVRTRDAESAVEDVVAGRADIAPSLMIFASNYIGEKGYRNLKIAGVAPYGYKGAFATGANRAEILSVMEKAYAAVPAEESRLLIERWASPSITLSPKEGTRTELVVLILSTTGIVMVLLAFAWRTLCMRRRERAHAAHLAANLRRTADQLGVSRYILDKSPNAVYLSDEDGLFTYVNARAATMSGYTAEQLLTMHVYDLNPDYTLPLWRERWKRMLDMPEDNFLNLRTRHRRADGTFIPVEVFAHLIRHEGKDYNLSLVSDITARVREEKAKARFASLADQALELTRAGYWSVPLDDSGDYFSSARAVEIFGDPPNPEYRYRVAHWLSCIEAVDPAIARATSECFGKACSGEIPKYDALYPYKRPVDGNIVWLRAFGVLVRDPDLPYPEMYGVVQDVTETIVAKRELEEARRAAEKANRLKSEFLANMSHEIRTPMNAILGYAQLMARDANLPASQREHVATINRAGEHLLALINDILEMSKIEAGHATLNTSALDLRDLLTGLVDLYGERARYKGLTLTLDAPDDLPSLIVSDAGKLRQALLNLLGNAVKFTSEGGVTLTVTHAPAPDGATEYTFTIADTGPGIAPDEVAKLFRPFVQSSAGHSAGGTGLGLAISRQYARMLGGDITLDSRPGEGSTFTLTMIAGPAAVGAVSRKVPRRPVLRLTAGSPTVRVLVADDVALNRSLLDTLLTPLGFEIRLAADGREAVQIFKEWKPHAILMDMRMPVMDGYEANRLIKADPGGHETFILALTASAFEEQKTVVLASGADAFLRKPFDRDELLAVLGDRLGLRYDYADTPETAKTPVAEGLPPLPQETVAALRKACEEADYEHLVRLCEALEKDHPDAAASLRRRVESFDYDGVVKLIS